ncbi:DUF6878 family protein [Hyphomicrobium sp. CS1BSMeth3]|uniref:DUF6878 family protein n=1 Tax=Hyphomicrobium sp. CS1BSMeth3 TaxID=1892844 RepID=UPI00092FFE78|nr:DUF6878 family protein [Hyphomicrobium sp. CS1BSMeth3]
MTTYDYELTRRRTVIARIKPILLAELQANGIATVCITYDGEGDEGQISGTLCFDPTNARIATFPAGVPNEALAAEYPDASNLPDVLESFAWDVIASQHDGFEINDGGYGDVTIDVAKGTITLEHNERYIDIHTEMTEI